MTRIKYEEMAELLQDTLRGIVKTVKTTDKTDGMVEMGNTGINCFWSLWKPTDGSNEKKFVGLNFEVTERCTVADYHGAAAALSAKPGEEVELDDYCTILCLDDEWGVDEPVNEHENSAD